MEEQVQVEWDDVNRLLQHHGFKPVCFADPVENKNLSDLVLLDKKSCGELRSTLRTMLTDSERRQALIQELVKSSNQLKEEAQEHMSRAAQQTRRASDLERLLDEVKTRVQDLEDRCLGKALEQHGNTQQEKQDAQNRVLALEQKLSKREEEAAQLHRKLYFTVKEEEQRRLRQDQAFQEICNRVSQQSSAADQQVLEVIDFYETKIAQLTGELRSVKGAAPGSEVSQERGRTAPSVTPSFQTVLKAHQEQQKESRLQIDELKKEVQRLKEEMQSRPTLKEVKFYKHKLRRLEGHKHDNIRLPEDFSAGNENISDQTPESRLGSHDHHVLRSPTHYTLASMVSHFQKLFDITSLSGVYPRMNEVYTQLGEMTNTMRHLRDVLSLDSRVPAPEVVNRVARLASSTQRASELDRLLGDGDIDRIILKVKQHEEFFPAFHALITDILQTLGVSLLDDVLPALRRLKRAEMFSTTLDGQN